MKNKKLLWIMAMVVLVVGSVIVEGALSDTLRGLTGRVGGTLGGVGGGWGLIVISVNATIIGLLFYLIITGFKFIDLKSNTGKTVFLIVLVLFSIYLSVNLSVSPDGKYQFIWSKSVVGEIMLYLFNGDPAKGPIGILRPSRILIFAGAWLVFSWFFIGFLKIGQGKNNFDYALAMLIAAEATRAGMSKGMLIFVGQIIALFMLYTQFKKEQGRHPLVAFIWAYVLQSLVVSGLFKSEDRIWASWFLTRISIPRSLPGLIWFVIGVFVILPLLAMGGIFLHKKEKEAGAKHNFVKNAGQHIWQKIVDFVNTTRIPVLNEFFRWLNLYNVVLGDPDKIEIGKTIRKIWFELFTNMNYLLRFEVYDAKGSYVREASDRLRKVFQGMKEQEGATYLHLYTETIVNANVDRYKIGTGFDGPNPDGSWRITSATGKGIREDFWFINNEGKLELNHSYKYEPGAFSLHLAILAFFKNFIEGIDYFKNNTPPLREVVETAEEKFKSNVKSDFDSMIDAVDKAWGSYEKYLDRRGSWSLIKSEQLTLLTQYKLTGEIKHTYKFARIGARIYRAPYQRNAAGTAAPRDSDNPPFFIARGADSFDDPLERPNDPFGDRARYTGQDVQKPLINNEVDDDGYFIEDLNEIRMTGNCHFGYIRRVKPKALKIFRDINGNPSEVMVDNIIPLPDFAEAASWLEQEWLFFFRDVRDGRFHPRSRISRDYTQRHTQERKFNYKNLLRTGRPNPDEGTSAFDREALKDAGRFVYWGKMSLLSTQNDMLNCDNPFPTLSTKGMAHYLRDFIDTFAQELEKKQAEYFVYDSGRDEALFSGSSKST